MIYRHDGNNEYVMTFEIIAGGGIDGVSGSDGIDVINFALGSPFGQGAFIAQDGNNSPGNQNFKLIQDESIEPGVRDLVTRHLRYIPRKYLL